MPYIIVQETAQESYYYLDENNKYSPFAEEAKQFESHEEAQKEAEYWNKYWQENKHPPELTIIRTFVAEVRS